jgi:hypothetical protein
MLLHDEITENGKELTFSELPVPAQKSIIYYMGIDGDAWADLIKDIDVSTEDGWEKAISAVSKQYGEKTYTTYDMPTDVFKELIMQTPSDFAGWYDTFEEYHEWYLSDQEPLNYPESQRWPALAWCDNEGIIDGWHRVHDYVAGGHKTIPLIL